MHYRYWYSAFVILFTCLLTAGLFFLPVLTLPLFIKVLIFIGFLAFIVPSALIFYENTYVRFGYLITPNALIENLHIFHFEKEYIKYLPRAFDDGFYTLEGFERNCYATHLNKYRAVEYALGYKRMDELLHDIDTNEKLTVKEFTAALHAVAELNKKKRLDLQAKI
ncbi:hypothetical protein UA32_12555 [Photobacterium angustum]|uniref:hypothetical protein n=1 Tax=Photobacterium angustum TaxID=661 RepID=UPI0005E6EC65|nr:hypothetical protein [Photobacterium angustum]KJG37777.1 hypothetical protein UA32_12555 [Photobacterium angustum]